jgi:short-subunit dehydrogenase
MNLAGKTALITGAGTGIGRALAIEASRCGIMVALTGRRPEKLQLTRAQLASPANCLVIAGDVTQPEARHVIRRRLTDEWGRLDVLVNNAGIIVAGPLALAGDAELDRLIAINLSAPMALIRDMLPLLRAAAPSRIVNVGSVLGDIGFPAFAAYSASKFGLRGLSVALRRELKGVGISVTYAAPRGVKTEATAAVADIVETLEMPLDAAERIARQIWNGVAAGRRSVHPRGRERIFMLVERLLPSIVDRVLNAQLKSSGLQRIIDNAEAATGFVQDSQGSGGKARVAATGTESKIGGR